MNEHPLDEESDALDVSPEHVRRRIENWLDRLETLFSDIAAWAAAQGWTALPQEPVPMREDLVERAGLLAPDQPSLLLRSPDGAELWVKPKGLWVIGANGRVDFYTPKGGLTLVDTADPFEPPRWILHRLGEGRGRPFTPDLIADMV